MAVLAWNFWGARPHGESCARAYNGGLGQSPQWGPVAEPLVKGLGGEAETISSFWTFTGSRKFVHFSKIWKRKKS